MSSWLLFVKGVLTIVKLLMCFLIKQHAHAEIVTVTVAVLIQIKLAIVNNLKLFTISQIVHNFSNSSL